MGRLLKLIGWPSAAAGAYRDAARANPLWAEAHFELGECLLVLGDWNGASEALAQAVRLQPDHFEARGNLVLALSKQEKTAEALAALESLARLRSQDAELYLLLGTLYRRAGRSDEAVRAFRWSVNLPPPPVHRRCYLGEALLGAAEWKTVLGSYVPAASLAPPPPVESPEWHSCLNQHPAQTASEFRRTVARPTVSTVARRSPSIARGLVRVRDLLRSAVAGPRRAVGFVTALGQISRGAAPVRVFPARPEPRETRERRASSRPLARGRAAS